MSDKPIELWLQTFRFWNCARSVRHGVVDPVTNTRRQLSEQEKIDEINYWNKGVSRKPLQKRYEELTNEAKTGKDYKVDESITHNKAAS